MSKTDKVLAIYQDYSNILDNMLFKRCPSGSKELVETFEDFMKKLRKAREEDEDQSDI